MEVIKKIIMYIAIVVLAIMFVTIVHTELMNNTYSRVAMVTEIDMENNLITATCANGNIYSFYDTSNDWFCGDVCSLIMFDNGTENIYDDNRVGWTFNSYISFACSILIIC